MRLECSSKSTKAQIRLAKMSWQAVPKSRTGGGEWTIAETRTCLGDEAHVDGRRSQLAAVCGGDELTVLCLIGWCCAMQSSKYYDSQFEVHMLLDWQPMELLQNWRDVLVSSHTSNQMRRLYGSEQVVGDAVQKWIAVFQAVLLLLKSICLPDSLCYKSYRIVFRSYVHLNLNNRQLSLQVTECADDIATWMKSNRLQLNPDKTKVLWCATSRGQHQLPSTGMLIDGVHITPVKSVWDLGIYIDADLSMRMHVKKTVSCCFAALCQLRQIRRYVPTSTF